MIVIPLRVDGLDEIEPVAYALKEFHGKLTETPNIGYVRESDTFCASQVLFFPWNNLEIRVWVSARTYDEAQQGWIELLTTVKNKVE